jgi:hypothetical protein
MDSDQAVKCLPSLVPFEELADNMYYYLDVDTDSWDPRRFSLVVWVNSIGQDIYATLNGGGLSGRDAEKLLFYLNEATRHLYPRSSKKQQMISLIDPFENDVKRRQLSLRVEETRRRLQADKNRTSEERRELKKKECKKKRRRLDVKPDDAKDDLNDFDEHLDTLKRVGRIYDEKYEQWKDLAGKVRDGIPGDR